MSGQNESLLLLRAEIEKTRGLLGEIDAFFEAVRRNELSQLGRTKSTALIVAQILENFYTCLETLFLRISRFFENSLTQERWHADLLEKMTLRVPGIRVAVISESTHRALEELLRFRHFKRYYFQLDYDWERLDFLTKKYREVYPAVLAHLDAFEKFFLEIESDE